MKIACLLDSLGSVIFTKRQYRSSRLEKEAKIWLKASLKISIELLSLKIAAKISIPTVAQSLLCNGDPQNSPISH
jgi:hypothetical protein